MDLLKDKILQLIEIKGPITAQEINNHLSILAHDPIRIIRKKIRKLILEDKIPIASSMEHPFGYFIATKDAKADHYAAQLKSRIYHISERLYAFDAARAKQIQLLLLPQSESKQ
jgi:gamma-glutamyl:cysteine ligase YbdK (ATP-grasp superfamily)